MSNNQNTPEYVLVLPRQILSKVGTAGIYPIDLETIDQHAYGFLPRWIAGNKSQGSIETGKEFPQVIGYVQFVAPSGDVLLYRRKSKDGVIAGRLSVGVGGHIEPGDSDNFNNTFLKTLYNSVWREIKEEAGIEMEPHTFRKPQTILSTWCDITSTIHVGFPITCNLTHAQIEAISLSPDEFVDHIWVPVAELQDMLKDPSLNFEPWSKLVIENMRDVNALFTE